MFHGMHLRLKWWQTHTQFRLMGMEAQVEAKVMSQHTMILGILLTIHSQRQGILLLVGQSQDWILSHIIMDLQHPITAHQPPHQSDRAEHSAV